MVFGGIASDFVHASNTELFLENTNLNDPIIFQSTLSMLGQEVVPEEDIILASSAYRKHLAQALYYKV